jgi:hypothetical protein
MGEVGRVLQQPRAPTGQPPTAELLAQRLRANETAMSTLLALLVHAGYFADRPDHDDLLVSVLRRLASRPTDQGGYTIWTNAQQYPTMLAVYALGLGTLVAPRPSPLARALATIRVPMIGKELPLGQAIASWSVLDDNTMKQLPGLDRHKTPTSDYLHGRLRDVARSVLPDDHEYDEVFDQVEYLLGVVCAHTRRGLGPIGRFVWRRGDSEPPVPDEPFATHAAALLSAGLFDGQREVLDATKATYDEWVGRSQLRF